MKKWMIIGVTSITLMHIFLFPVSLEEKINLLIYASNLFVFFLGLFFYSRKVFYYALGYFVVFVLTFLCSGKPVLFSLSIILYAILFRNNRLLGYFFIVLLSVLIIPSYWLITSIVVIFLYTIFLELKKRWGESFFVYSFVFGFPLFAFLLFPFIHLLIKNTPESMLSVLNLPDFRFALMITIFTATISTGIVFLLGVPLAYAIARLRFKGRNFINSLIDLPILLPHTIAGIALISAFGPKTAIGNFLSTKLGITMTGTIIGIILAQTFVSAPFLIRSAINSFILINPKLEHTSRTLGATPIKTFFNITLPIAFPGIINGCVLSWARAISETGSIMIIAYYPSTISIFTYDTFIRYGLKESMPVAAIVVVICLWIFILSRWLYMISGGKEVAPG